MTFDSSKTLGGIGALMLFIAAIVGLVVNYGGLIVGAVGLVLVLIGLHGLADYYRERSIFSNALYGVFAVVIGVITAVGVFVATIFFNVNNIKAFITQIFPGWNGDWASLQNMTPDPNAFQAGNFDFNTIVPFIVGILAVLVVIWVFAIIATFFARRSLKMVSDKSTVGLFGTAGLLMLIGAVLIVAFLFGLLLIWIGVLLLAIGFFQLRPLEPVVAQAPPPPLTV
ncbi:DUF996 domain-containing protein [Candidatus Bathyarchaeota archaeon]|nr:DUF996 domain-containing protein [Candidatus Bathyarchaeota archaeon]